MELINPEQYVGKKVLVVRNLKKANEQGHMAEEIEGTIEVANNQAILIKPKGRTMQEMIEAADLESIELVATTPKAVKQKVLKKINIDGVRQHLVDRHGWSVSFVNGMSDESADAAHGTIAHSDLGHKHEDTASASE